MVTRSGRALQRVGYTDGALQESCGTCGRTDRGRLQRVSGIGNRESRYPMETAFGHRTSQLTETWDAMKADWDDVPQHHGRGFTTKFAHLGGRGFFPVHGGGVGEAAPRERPLVVVFGTDWGPRKRYERCAMAFRQSRDCECQRTLTCDGAFPTERRLLEFLKAGALRAGRGLSDVFVTKAVLGLVEGEDRATGCVEVYRRHTDYLTRCGQWHRRWLDEKKPEVAWVLGAANLEVYGGYIWPELFGPVGSTESCVWHGTASLSKARARKRMATAGEVRVLLMPHPLAPGRWPPVGDLELLARVWKAAARSRRA